MKTIRIVILIFLALHGGAFGTAVQASAPSPAGGGESHVTPLPHPLSTYEKEENEQGIVGLGNVLLHRIRSDSFNMVATAIFLLAMLHTFAAGHFRKLAHRWEEEHRQRIEKEGRTAAKKPYRGAKDDVCFPAEIMHFLGEVEAIFGIWVVPLVLAMIAYHGWDSVTYYFDHSVHYTEPMFVVCIMAIASTRPVMKFAERCLGLVAGIGGRTVASWWLSILILAPLLGSFITEPAAMTIAAMLLAKQFYEYQPSRHFQYATIGLLFVNISVGGTLTHFAAPPVLMVAGRWGWDMLFMLEHFGIKAFIGIVLSTTAYFLIFRREFRSLQKRCALSLTQEGEEEPIPLWVTVGTLFFMAWTVGTLHHPPLFIGGFLFFLAFSMATHTHHDDISIKSPLLVGFFLAGLVTHGALQQWWIAPVLGSLGEFPLFIGATILTSFNDNAAITFLASQVPAFNALGAADAHAAYLLQYAVVAGAVTGGGITVIANAPNPAGQSILQRYFEEGVSPFWLALWALPPTIVQSFCFMGLAFFH